MESVLLFFYIFVFDIFPLLRVTSVLICATYMETVWMILKFEKQQSSCYSKNPIKEYLIAK